MAKSAAEHLLASMGLGEAMTAVKTLIDQGAIQKILAFADNVEALNLKLDKVQRDIEIIKRHVGIECVEPGSNTGNVRPSNADDSGGFNLSSFGIRKSNG